jgi:hypothetical protein
LYIQQLIGQYTNVAQKNMKIIVGPILPRSAADPMETAPTMDACICWIMAKTMVGIFKREREQH